MIGPLFTFAAFHRATRRLAGPERLLLFLRLPESLQAGAFADLAGRVSAERRGSV